MTAPLSAAGQVPDSIEKSLADIALERSLMARLEMIQVADDVGERFLNQVVGVERPTGGSGQATVGPPVQFRQVSGAQVVQCGRVPGLGPDDEIDRRQGLPVIHASVRHSHLASRGNDG